MRRCPPLRRRATSSLVVSTLFVAALAGADSTPSVDRIDELIARMTVDEKVGQMSLRGFSSRSTQDPRILQDAVRAGEVGALINVMDRTVVDELQRIAVEESRLGIPVLYGRDVIHGFRTIFPIPLGQAATWNPELVEHAARISALEASTFGIRWTFAPMVDLTRDPRWGRIAESPGEDPYLAEVMAVAGVRGFQGDDPSASDRLAACVKHFAAYGAAEGGRDYNTANVPEAVLRNVYLRPFHAAVDAGALTFMTAFNEVNGVPASGDPWLLRDVLRDEWGFRGLVVSDWESVTEMIAHGFAADARHAAELGATAGVDLEMTSRSFTEQLPALIEAGVVPESVLDGAVRHVLWVKEQLGLFDRPERDASRDDTLLSEPFLDAAREMVRQSAVLLTNDGVLPLGDDVGKVAVIGPLADAPHEQLGTWTFDGKKENSRTPLAALREHYGDDRVLYAPGLEISRTRDHAGFDAALDAARAADVTLFFAGEEAILSGEAHSRADIRLPGAQEALIRALGALDTPLVAVVLSGRPNVLAAVVDSADALLVAWHPGTMAGPGLVDLLTGAASPSGRLPVTWPKDVGQIPIYYNHKNTGRPAPEELQAFDDIPVGAWQSSLSNTSRYLDLGTQPHFPFGFGLTYSTFEYTDLTVEPATITVDDNVTISATLTNTGTRAATEVAQLYTRDLVGSLTRPVRELKGFERVTLDPGASTRVTFELAASDLAFYDRHGKSVVEPGAFRVWIGPHAADGVEGGFTIEPPSRAEATP
ncbi:MAG: glycoside hydrolase family 3 N-terminal domain-containing protein [Acidobacteriota bacterium]